MTVRPAMSARGVPLAGVGQIAVAVLLVLLVLVVGALSAVAPPAAAALGIGGIAIVIGFVLPLPWLLVTTLFVSAVFSGSVEYFLGVSQANWIPFVLAGFVAVRAILESGFGLQTRAFGRSMNPAGLPFFAWPALIYLSLVIASAAANLIPVAQALAAFKNYLLMWGVLVAFFCMGNVGRTSTWLWRSVVIVAILQLPVVLYQRIFIAGRLGNTASSLGFDAINGTFGGGILGGRSGALVMFTCIALAYLLILWRERRISGIRMAGLSLLMLPTLFIVEVKAVIFWLPAVAFIVFFAQIRRRPFLFLIGVACSLLLVLGVIAAYRFSYYAPAGDQTLATFFSRDLAYMWDPERYNPATREMGRVSVLVHWWNETSVTDLARWLFGYGPGASRGTSSVAVGSIAGKYPFFIDISAAAMLVWDLGVAGLISFCSILMFGAVSALRLKRMDRLPTALRIELEAAMVGLLLILSSVIYVRDVIDGTTIQFMLFFLLGLVIHGNRQALRK